MKESIINADELASAGPIAIVRSKVPVPIRKIAEALMRGGIRSIEVTLTTPDALGNIADLRQAYDGQIYVGAGTILSIDDAETAIYSGAQFIVTPAVQLATIGFCRDRGVPIACGAMTPTEAFAVHHTGADFVKLFPAESLGVAYVKALLGPMPFLRLVPTGGVNKENIAAFMQAGCAGVALGSNLVSADVIAEQDWTTLERDARDYVELWTAARRG